MNFPCEKMISLLKIIDSNNQPIVDQTVEFYDQASIIDTKTTDANGFVYFSYIYTIDNISKIIDIKIPSSESTGQVQLLSSTPIVLINQ